MSDMNKDDRDSLISELINAVKPRTGETLNRWMAASGFVFGILSFVFTGGIFWQRVNTMELKNVAIERRIAISESSITDLKITSAVTNNTLNRIQSDIADIKNLLSRPNDR